MRIADSVLLTCWPPAPLARKVSICRSAGIDLHFHFLGLGQHRHCDSGGVDAALGFGFGHTLHPVHAAFELQAGIGTLSGDRRS